MKKLKIESIKNSIAGRYKMRKLYVLWALMLCTLAGGTLAGTIDVWIGPAGSFTDGSKWQNGGPVTWTSTSTGDELKITGNGTVCTADTAGNWIYRLTVASGPDGSTLEIVNGGSLGMGEVRIGAAGATSAGSVGYVSHIGGTFSVKDLILGRWSSGKPTAQAYYTISGGTLTYNAGAAGRLYVGAGNNGGYTEGTFTIVGNAATILMDSLYVGSENGTNYGKGILVYQIGAAGVSPITIDDAVYLDTAGASSVANLEISTTATSLPAADILLVRVTSGNALTGTFDALNGGSAAEGTEIILAGNTYELTYQYAAEAGVNNDIALVYQGGAVTRVAHTPIPQDGADVDAELTLLDWINPDPNVAGNPVYCDVYLGAEPNRLLMDKTTLGNDISQVDINTANFPTYGNLQTQTLYYWAVDVHDAGDVYAGPVWSFFVTSAEAPVVDAGPDQVTWLGNSGTPGQEVIYLDGTTSDDGPYTVLWTQVANGAPAVTISPNNTDDTSVTVTAPVAYEFMLTADDGILQTSDTVQIIVGSTSCDASHMSTGAAYNAMDMNQDCIVDLEDFAIIAANWLICTDTLTDCVQ